MDEQENTAPQNYNPCQSNVKTVIWALKNHSENERVQCIGFHVILQLMRRYTIPITFFLNKECAIVIIAAIKNFKSYRVQWRAYTIMMTLSCNLSMCVEFEKEGGCEAIMNTFERVGNRFLCQTALWILNYLCKEENCLQKLLELGLKPLLRNFINKQCNSTKGNYKQLVLVPLELRNFCKTNDSETT